MSEMVSLYGRSPEFLSVLRVARLVAVTNATVLLSGESGTGKELIAQSIHRDSRRNLGPFVTVNCAALPESLAESELFGHARGAFTGAVHGRSGRVAAAHGGTLVLDEIGETPLPIQAKLLRFLESGECQSLGMERPHHVDVRVIAATNRDLRTLVSQGTFRSDLYFRLHVATIELPPLRDRQGDVELLLDLFLHDLTVLHHLPKPRLAAATRKILHAYHWPGNIRELRNFCERSVIFHPGEVILPEHLPREFLGETTPPLAMPVLSGSGVSLESLEKNLIQQALSLTGGNRTRAARMLDLSRDTLLYRMKKYALR